MCDFEFKKSEAGKDIRRNIIEGVGYFVLEIFRGSDIWGVWHEDERIVIMEVNGGIVNMEDLICRTHNLEPVCYTAQFNEQCVDEDHDCNYRDEEGRCIPPIVRYKITVESEVLGRLRQTDGVLTKLTYEDEATILKKRALELERRRSVLEEQKKSEIEEFSKAMLQELNTFLDRMKISSPLEARVEILKESKATIVENTNKIRKQVEDLIESCKSSLSRMNSFEIEHPIRVYLGAFIHKACETAKIKLSLIEIGYLLELDIEALREAKRETDRVLLAHKL